MVTSSTLILVSVG